MVAYIVFIISSLKMMWKEKIFSRPHLILIKNIQEINNSDEILLNMLMQKDIEVLEYTLTQLQAELKSLEARVSFVIGTIKKTGLLPAILALFLFFQKVNVSNFNESFHPIITAFLFATPCLYLFSGFIEETKSHLERHVEIYKLIINMKSNLASEANN